MKEFEELEGFTDQNFDDEASLDDNDEDDAALRPPVASNLSNSDVYYEVFHCYCSNSHNLLFSWRREV